MRGKKSQYGGVLTVCLAASMLFTGCTSTDNKTQEGATSQATGSQVTSSTAPKKDPIKLTMWGGVPAESGPQAVVENWNKNNPDIQVEYVRYVNDEAGNLKLDTALVSGQQVDLYMNYAFSTYEKRLKAGNALDLSTMKDYNVDEKMGTGAAVWKVNGKYYGVPTSKTLSFVWLNKNMLDAKGLAVPTDWTLDDVQSYASKLKGDKIWGFAESDSYFTVPINGSLLKQSLLMVKPDGTSALDNPYTVKTLQVYSDMMFKDKSMMPHAEQITSKPALDQMFVKGQTAMLFSTQQIFRTTNNLKDFPRDFKVAAAPAPKVSKDQNDYMYAGGLGDTLTINPQSKYKEEAWKFLKWYADEGMLPLASGGRVPASKDFKVEDAVKAMFAGVEATYDLDSIKRVMFGNAPLALTQLDAKTSSDLQVVHDRFFTQKISAEDAAKEMARIHNENIKASKK